MEYLEAVLAFAVVMIILATFVTGLVEIAARFLALRSRVLGVMLQRFAERELLPLVHRRIEAALEAKRQRGEAPGGTVPKVEARRLLSRLLVNPVAFSVSSPWETADDRGRAGQVENLSVYAFLQRFAKTELGQALARECRDELQPILVDIARTYERYAAASREVFRRKANYISGLLAIALAFALNVNAPLLFSHLVANPAARDALIAQGETAYAAFQAQQTQLEGALERLEALEPQDQGEGAEQVPADTAGVAADARTEADREAAIEALRESLQALRDGAAQAEALEDLGLPILGNAAPFDRAAWCRAVKAWDADGEADADPGEERDACLNDEDRELSFKELARSGWTLLVWVPGVLLGGVLIGLGGPFWFRVFESLSQLLQVLRGLRGVKREEAADPTDPDKPEGGGTPQAAKSPEKMAEAFLIAAGEPVSPAPSNP